MTPALTQAIAAVRARGLVAVKTSRNTGINSEYASYADVWAVLAPVLTEYGLSVGFLPGPVRKDNEAWVQTLVAEITHGNETKSVSFEIVFPEGNRGVNITQRQGMAHTYGKRYALVNLFHVITGDDDDAERLGQARHEERAPKPDKHWSEYCYAPLLGVGSEETQGAWSMLANPDNPEVTLGDLAPGAIARLWTRFPDHAGINAWRAEIVSMRAKAKGATDWQHVLDFYSKMGLPAAFTDCTGEQLNNLALALK